MKLPQLTLKANLVQSPLYLKFKSNKFKSKFPVVLLTGLVLSACVNTQDVRLIDIKNIQPDSPVAIEETEKKYTLKEVEDQTPTDHLLDVEVIYEDANKVNLSELEPKFSNKAADKVIENVVTNNITSKLIKKAQEEKAKVKQAKANSEKTVTTPTKQVIEKIEYIAACLELDKNYKPVYKANSTKVDYTLTKRGSYKARTYSIQKGDTLGYISYIVGKSKEEIAAYNNLENLNKIRIGQILIVSDCDPNKKIPKPVVSKQPSLAEANITPTPVPAKPVSQETKDKLIKSINQKDGWVWPATGKIVKNFKATQKNISIAGKLNDPIVAAYAGDILYAGKNNAGDNWIIIRHPDQIITSYEYVGNILVKQGAKVKAGTKIASIGIMNGKNEFLFLIREGSDYIDPEKKLP